MTNINDTYLKDVGKRIRKLRKDKKLTQAQLSNALLEQHHITIDKRSISRYETGEGLPETENLIYLADFLETPIDYILYGKKTCDENSFTWYENFKRLNRLIYTMKIGMLRDEKNTSEIYLKLFDDESKEWFGRIERFIDNRKNMFSHKGIEKNITVEDLDALFEDFRKDRTQLCPIEEKSRRSSLVTQHLATIATKEENGEIVITTRIQKH